MDWDPDLRLQDGNILLRPYAPGDIDALYEAARESIEEVFRWLPWCHPGYARSDSEEWIDRQQGLWAERSSYDFVILDADEGRYLGGCGINGISWLHRFANLGYWIRTSAVGRGVATTAATLTAGFGFERLGLHRLELVVEPENVASIRVAVKLGAKREGLLRGRLAVASEQRDALMFSLVASDWPPALAC